MLVFLTALFENKNQKHRFHAAYGLICDSGPALVLLPLVEEVARSGVPHGLLSAALFRPALDCAGLEDFRGHQLEHGVGINAAVGDDPAVDGFRALQHAARLVGGAPYFNLLDGFPQVSGLRLAMGHEPSVGKTPFSTEGCMLPRAPSLQASVRSSCGPWLRGGHCFGG